MKKLIFNIQLFASTVSGTTKADTIENTLSGMTINALAGNDAIMNSGTNVYINGGNGADIMTLSSSAMKNTIIGGKGNDSIYSRVINGVLFSYEKGDGNDYISGWTAKDTLTITGGAYKISTVDNNVLVSIEGGEKITLAGAKGRVININNSLGKNFTNSKTDSVITGTTYDDTFQNTGANVTIYGLDGNDYIDNSGASVKVCGGAGADTIYNKSVSTYIEGGADNDFISSRNDYVKYLTLDGGSGDDTIYNCGDYSYVLGGSGNDSMYGFVDDFVTLNSGAGNDTISGIYYFSSIETGLGDDIINFSGKRNTIITGDGNDSIYSYDNEYWSINSGNGNDTVQGTYKYVTINSGDGNDLISLYGGAGNIILGGNGDETIYAKEGTHCYKYASGDGNDIIFGFNTNDTLQITSGNYSTAVSGNDFVLSIGSGSIILKDSASKRIRIMDASDKVVYYNDWSVMSGTAGNDSLVNDTGVVTVNGLAGDDTIYNTGNKVSVYGGDGDDKISTRSTSWVTINGGKGNDSIYDYDGYDNKIIGGEGSDTIYSRGEYTHINAGSGDDSIHNNGHYSKVYGGNGNDTIYGVYRYSTVSGGDGDDKILLTDDYESSISGGDGNDMISLAGYGNYGVCTINAGTGNDTIYGNAGGQEKIFQYASKDGNDVIYQFGDSDVLHIKSGNLKSVTLNGSDVIFTVGSNTITLKDKVGEKIFYKLGNGSLSSTLLNNPDNNSNDIIGTEKSEKFINALHYATIKGMGGNDTIINSGTGALLNGGKGNDIISLRSSAEDVTIIGGAGNDIIYNNSNDHLFQYAEGDGNDTIIGFGYDDSLQITSGEIRTSMRSGDDMIFYIGEGRNNSIRMKNSYYEYFYVKDNVITTFYCGYNTLKALYGTDDSDTLANTYDNRLVSALSGNDYITTKGNKTSIEGGAGNDQISLGSISKNNTINGGKGNDTIYTNGNGNWIQYAYGDGKDTIIGFGGNDLLQITSGLISTSAQSGSDMVFYIGEGKTNAITIKDSAELPLVVNNGKVIGLSGVPIPITLNSYEDYINNENNATIYAGRGSNYIINNANNVLIDGGAGNDEISLGSSAENNTLNGGAGNDTIYLNKNANLVQYDLKDGSDTIIGFSKGDSLKVISSTGQLQILSRTQGSNTVFEFSNGQYVRYVVVTDIAGKKWKSEGLVITLDEETVSGTAKAEKITNTNDGVIINAVDGADTIINGGNQVYIDGGAGNDKISLSTDSENNTLIGGKSNDTIYTNGKGNLIQYATGDGKDTIVGFSGDDSIQITSGTISKSVKSGSNMIFGVGTGSITIKDGATMNLKVTDNIITPIPIYPTTTPYADKYTNTDAGATIYAVAGNDTLINTANDTWLDGGKGNDKISLSSDSKNNTLVGGKGNDTIYTNGKGNLIQYATGDGKDTIVGFGYDDSIQITSGTISKSVKSGSNMIFGVGSGSIIIKDGATMNLQIADNVITSLYVPEPRTLSSGADKYNNTDADATIYAVAGNDTITNTSNNCYIDGGVGNDRISLSPDSENNTLLGGKGNDTIYTNGEGNLIQYASGDGKDVIFGFSGDDSIQITEGSVSKTVKSGKDLVLGVGSGSITVKDGATMNWQIADNVITSLYAPESITLSSSADKYSNAEDDATIYAVAGKDTITNTADKVYIDGGVGNDKISLNSDSKNNTLLGGKGNDSIYTNGKGNLIQYAEGDGKDVIVGFSGDDSIRITSGKITKKAKSGTNLLITVGSGTSNVITIKNTTLSNIEIEDGVITFNSSTSELLAEDYWFEENNLIDDELRLDSLDNVTENNYSIGENVINTNFETAQSDSLSNFFVYSD